MQDENLFPSSQFEDQKQKSKNIRFWEALIPIIVLIIILAYNVFVYGDNATGGPNQFALIFAGVVAAVIGFSKKIT